MTETTTRDALDPIAVLDAPGDRERAQYIYGTDTFLVRLTRAGYDIGGIENWHVETCRYAGHEPLVGDGFDYVGTIPRGLVRVVLRGYLESA